jgi:hypothetical protein
MIVSARWMQSVKASASAEAAVLITAVVYVRGVAGFALLIAVRMGTSGRQSPEGDESAAGGNRNPQRLLLLNSPPSW